MSKGIKALLMAACVSVLAGCSSIDDTRIPAAPVNVPFNTVGDWNVYGIGGALDWCKFIKNEGSRGTYVRWDGKHLDYPFVISTYTGFGGVLLVGDLYGNPVAYDLACPYECKADIRVEVDKNLNQAVCPHCHSTYSIYDNYGYPTGGPAAERHLGLTRYAVVQGSNPYMAIRR